MNRIISFTLCIVLIMTAIFSLDNKVSAKTVTKSGYYSTGLTAKGSAWHKDYIKKVVFKKKKIITYGSFYYTKKPIGGGKYLKVKKRTFKISPKCKYVFIDSFPEDKKYSQKLTKSKIKKMMNQGIKNGEPINYCYFVVKKGKLVRILVGYGE